MSITNWDTFKCRCSGISKIMANSRSNPQLTEKQKVELDRLLQKGHHRTPAQDDMVTDLLAKKANSEKIILSDTCIEYLIEVHSLETTGRVSIKKEMEEIDQIEKGKMVEEDCITLLSIVDGVLYEKNDERIENDFLSGEPDVFTGPEIMQAEMVTDIKASFDEPGFKKKMHKGLENGWEEQVQGYGDITGSKILSISHCLVSLPLIMQLDFKKRMFYKGDYATEEAPEFKRKWSRLEKSMNFDDTPHRQRVFKIKVEPFSELYRQQVYDRVKVCREWLHKFDEEYQKLNLQVGNESVTFESN